MPSNNNATYFLDLVQKSRRGKFKIYIGMSAGVGKTYRMLQESHTLLSNDIDVQIGFVETHNRKETAALLDGLPIIPRRKLFYKGKELEEMDVQAIINTKPEVVIVDELAHSNIEGSRHQKRWEDVIAILEAGINVISAVNIQHIESLHDAILKITGVDVSERIPDKIVEMADDIVNIDLPSDELIGRLKDGKIYPKEKIPIALKNFFQSDHILQLRELVLKEVATHVKHKVDKIISRTAHLRQERFLACINTNPKVARNIIRKTARFAGYYSANWFVLYVETPSESSTKIPLDKQRHLINNYKLATELGANILRIHGNDVTQEIVNQCVENKITTVFIGKPYPSFWNRISPFSIINCLLRKLSAHTIDLVVLSEIK